jgi:hypothetical protein
MLRGSPASDLTCRKDVEERVAPDAYVVVLGGYRDANVTRWPVRRRVRRAPHIA